MSLALLAALGACASTTRLSSPGTAPQDPGSSIISADLGCAQVVAAVRDKLRASSFGSAQETSTRNGGRFELPWQRDGEVRRKATVTVTCYGRSQKSSRVSVDVEAQCRQKNASWKDCSNSGDLERRVLDALYPLR